MLACSKTMFREERERVTARCHAQIQVLIMYVPHTAAQSKYTYIAVMIILVVPRIVGAC